jgi:hypothetical protein
MNISGSHGSRSEDRSGVRPPPHESWSAEQPILRRSRGLQSRWLALFDRVVGTQQQRRGQLQADRIGGLDVDREFDPGRELHRQFFDLGAPQDAIEVGRRDLVRCDDGRSVGHQAAVGGVVL